MPENDKIYAEDAVVLLEELARQAVFDNYANQNELAKLLGFTESDGMHGRGDQLRRIKGTRPGRHGWPLHYDHVEHIRDALYEIADDYSGPAPFIRVADSVLRQRGIIVPGLTRAVDASSCTSLREQWVSSPSDDKAFVDACDLIVTRCRKDYGGDRAKTDGTQVLSSPLAAALSAVLDEECTIVSCSGDKIHIERDGSGPIDLTLPETIEDLAASVLPRRLLVMLESHQSISSQLMVERLLSPNWDRGMANALRSFFSNDGGHRFFRMVESCQKLLTAYADESLLWNRITKLFIALANASTDGAAVRESLRVIKLYSRNDAPRMLAAAILSTLINVNEHGMLKRIVNGRWG